MKHSDCKPYVKVRVPSGEILELISYPFIGVNGEERVTARVPNEPMTLESFDIKDLQIMSEVEEFPLLINHQYMYDHNLVIAQSYPYRSGENIVIDIKDTFNVLHTVPVDSLKLKAHKMEQLTEKELYEKYPSVKINHEYMYDNEVVTVSSYPYYNDSDGIIVIEITDSNSIRHIVPVDYVKPKRICFNCKKLLGTVERETVDNQTVNVKESIDQEIGEVSAFKSGAVRSKDVDEYRYDLISPFGLRALARAHKEGEKYPAWNSEHGFPIHDLLNHVWDHLVKFSMGDRKEPHMGKIMWGCSMIEHELCMRPEKHKMSVRGPGCLPPDNPDNLKWKDIK